MGLSLNAVYATSYWDDAPYAMIDRSGPRPASQMDGADRRRSLLAALQRLLLSGASSRRPLRPSALPAPRPRIAVGLSTCGGGGPCRANLWIGDPRDRIEHIVVHRHRERLVLLLDKG